MLEYLLCFPKTNDTQLITDINNLMLNEGTFNASSIQVLQDIACMRTQYLKQKSLDTMIDTSKPLTRAEIFKLKNWEIKFNTATIVSDFFNAALGWRIDKGFVDHFFIKKNDPLPKVKKFEDLIPLYYAKFVSFARALPLLRLLGQSASNGNSLLSDDINMCFNEGVFSPYAMFVLEKIVHTKYMFEISDVKHEGVVPLKELGVLQDTIGTRFDKDKFLNLYFNHLNPSTPNEAKYMKVTLEQLTLLLGKSYEIGYAEQFCERVKHYEMMIGRELSTALFTRNLTNKATQKPICIGYRTYNIIDKASNHKFEERNAMAISNAASFVSWLSKPHKKGFSRLMKAFTSSKELLIDPRKILPTVFKYANSLSETPLLHELEPVTLYLKTLIDKYHVQTPCVHSAYFSLVSRLKDTSFFQQFVDSELRNKIDEFIMVYALQLVNPLRKKVDDSGSAVMPDEIIQLLAFVLSYLEMPEFAVKKALKVSLTTKATRCE